MSLWQTIGDNFYPERADFTVSRSIGTEFAANLMTSYPLMARRDLGDQIGTMLRPSGKEWFHISTGDEKLEDNDSRRWLEMAERAQRRAMYDPVAMLARATREGDHDFAAFGQCVLSVVPNYKRTTLLYRCWHLRDVAWLEGDEGRVCNIFRKWKPQARILQTLFPGKLHEKVVRLLAKEPLTEVECMHFVVEAPMYDDDARGMPYWSIYYDVANQHVMEAVPTKNKEYVVPRWQTVSGSQYAFSPATVAALPDSRLLQAMMHTILEAGEKAVNPPMIATQDVVRSDISVYAGGVTWVDQEYDERLGEALRPMQLDTRGIPLGVDLAQRTQQMIAQAFYLNKLTLPQRAPDMTAYEVGQRIQEYIRGALPLFEPMEMDYNAQLCDLTFDLLMRLGTFGSPLDMPKKLRGAEIRFRFESPLHDAIEAQNGQKFLEAHQLLAQAATLDPNSAAIMDAQKAIRDVLTGIGVPADWTRSESEMADILGQQNSQINPQDIEQASKLLQNLDKGATSAQNLAGTTANAALAA